MFELDIAKGCLAYSWAFLVDISLLRTFVIERSFCCSALCLIFFTKRHLNILQTGNFAHE